MHRWGRRNERWVSFCFTGRARLRLNSSSSVQIEEITPSRNRTNPKPRSTLPSPRTARNKRKARKDRSKKQKIPCKTKVELRSLVESHVGPPGLDKFTDRDKERPGFIGRKAASDKRRLCDAAKILSAQAFKEGRVDDGRQVRLF